MNSDLEIIKELEREIGLNHPLPKRGLLERIPKIPDGKDEIAYENMAEWNCYGYFVDEKNNVVGLAIASSSRHTLNLKKIPSTLFKLKHLKTLNLADNQITTIPDEITTLHELERLQLLFNNITEIKPSLLDLGLPIIVNRTPKRGISIPKDFLEIPPPEIVEQGNEAIKNYFAQIEQAEGQTQYLFEAKLLIIGDGGTGKTSFRRKIRDADAVMPEDKDTTLGIEVDVWNYSIQFPEHGDVPFHVNLWDFGGQNIYRGTHQIFFSGKSYYVLVADSRKEGTDFSYWLNTVEQLAGDDSTVLILLNKKYGREIRFDERGYRSHFGKIIKEVFKLDLQNDAAKIPILQDTVKFHLKQLPGIGDPLPPTWVQIRGDLLKEKEEEKEKFITFDRFREICAAYDITDPSVIRTLSGYFSRIGAFTHYIDDDVLRERIYLNSNWLVNTVYEVLDNKRAREKRGRLNEADVKDIWQKDDLSFEINRLTQLMDKFGLMYHIPKSKDYVVPEHLPTDQPYDAWEHESAPDLLHFIYEFDKYMPKGLMSRLIVSLHRHIHDHDRVWHRGFNIELKGTHAEIIETYGSENTFQIRIAGTNKIELLAIIREHLAEVLEPFRNLNYKQHVPCTCDECAAARIPGFHDYNTLLKLRGKGMGSQCPESGKMMDTSDLLRITEFVKGEDEQVDDNESVDHAALKTIELFLASSSELKTDRERVEIWVNRENKKLVKKGVFLQLNLWEDFLDAISEIRLQDEYNKVVAQSDIVLCLFATKVGKYTEEEFEVAHAHFKESGKPKYIYTYFKEVQISASDMSIVEDLISLKNFKEKLDGLGHFYTSYNSIEDLSGQLKNQLDRIIEDMR
jgi:hypothetical protein